LPERTVAVGLTADVTNYLAGMSRASAATKGVGKDAQTTGELTRAFVGKIGGSIQSLGSQVGGTVGSLLETIGGDIETVSGKAVRLSTALEVGGGAAVAAGIGLQQLGSGAVQATEQLNAAITANGESVERYTNKIEEAVSAGQKLGFGAEETKAALTRLIPAAGSTSKALDVMSVTTNLAAARHISLVTAATQVARILGGSGSKTLNQYGIQMDGVGSKTAQGNRALDQLSKKLDGQASASVDNFAGGVKVMTTQLSDFVNEAAGPAGAVLTGLGAAANVAGVSIDIYRLISARAAASQLAMGASIQSATADLGGEAVAARTAAVSMGSTGLGGAVARLASGPVGIAVIGTAALYAASSIGTMTDAAYNNTIKFKNATDAAAAYQKQLSLGQTGPKGFLGNATTDRGSALQLTTGANEGVGQFFTSLGLGGLNSEFEGATSSIAKIDASMAQLIQGGHAKEAAAEFTKWKSAAKDAGISLSDLKAKFPDYAAALDSYAGSAGKASSKTDDLGTKFSTASFNAKALKISTDDLQKSLATYGGAAQNAESATESYYAALDAASESIKTNKRNIDDSTAAGRANNQALYAVASAADAVAAANLKAKTPIAQVQAGLADAKGKFIATAEAMGYNTTQAQALADKLISIGTFKYNYDSSGIKIATNDLDTYINELNKLPGVVELPKFRGKGSSAVVATGGLIDHGHVSHFASGGGYGQFRGPGTGTSDSIPAMVSNGEYINSAATVARLGVDFFQRLNRGGSPATYQPAPTAAVMSAPSTGSSRPRRGDVNIGQVVQQSRQSAAEFAQTLGFYLGQVS
jgi:hypothetical protein